MKTADDWAVLATDLVKELVLPPSSKTSLKTVNLCAEGSRVLV